MTKTITATLDAPFAEVVTAVSDALRAEGFRIRSDIALDAILEAGPGTGTGTGTGPYQILTVYDPALAQRGLTAGSDIGMLLPCNVVVHRDARGRSVVRAADPQHWIESGHEARLRTVAIDIHDRFVRALSAVTEDLALAADV